MGEPYCVTRRNFMVAGAGLATGSVLRSATDKSSVPMIAKRVEHAFKAPCKEPNDLAFVDEGLWILDQVDPNKAFLVHPENGSVIRSIQTESIHGSGIALYKDALWIASTKTSDGTPPKTMKVDPRTGKTIQQWVTPGSGIWTTGPNATVSGAHGIKFVNGQYWMAVPASGKLYLMEPETDRIVRTIPAPGIRTHGIAWDNGSLWCVESNDRAIYRMDPNDGKLLAKIQLTRQDPAIHGMDIHNGVLWYCDAESGSVCRLV